MWVRARSSSSAAMRSSRKGRAASPSVSTSRSIAAAFTQKEPSFAACLDPGEVRRSGGPGPLVAEILERSGRPAVPGVAKARFRGTPSLTRRRSEVAAERIFVVGDAAGYVEPFTGEGMGWAMCGAGAVAPLAAEAVRGWDPALAERWRRRHARIVLRRQAVCRAVASLLRRPILTRAAVRVLQAAPDLARPLIAHLNAPPKELAA